MKLPSVPVIELPGGYRWVQHEVDLWAWQAHLMKHPLGIYAMRRTPPRPWNAEGWDGVEPPAITEAARAGFIRDVVRLPAGRRCGIAEWQGAKPVADRVECYDCRDALLLKCRDRLAQESTSSIYLRETERLLRQVSDGHLVPRKKLSAVLLQALRAPAKWEGLVVLSVGREGLTPLLRCSDSQGFRTELYIHAGAQLRWKTTYRAMVASRPNDRCSWVLDTPPPEPKLSLSEVFVVPRDWGNRHGI